MASTNEVINKKEDVMKKITELYPLLSYENKKTAESLHELAVNWNMKIGIRIRGNTENSNEKYDITYSAKKPFTRSIFMYKINLENDKIAFGIKPKFINIDVYRPVIEACPDNIKNVIKNISDCVKCGNGCNDKTATYTIDGNTYNPCPYKGDYFEKLNTDEWELVRNLIVCEYNAHIAV